MRFCGMCGRPLAQVQARRERRRVTTVFIDLAGFSTLTRHFDPEKLRDLADDILTVVAGIIEQHDGYIDAFQGDGLIALFGAPHSHPNDPERAILAAAEGLRAIEQIGRSKGYELKGRAGVNTGLVIAGNLGSGKAKDYTVMGSAVNLAARLEAAATPGEVWVGPETYRATRHSLRFSPTEVLSLAGFPDITRAHRFVGEAQQRDPYEHISFVGREAELAELWRQLNALKQAQQETQGRPQQELSQELWVVGDAGSGKSRLLREFAAQVVAHGAAQVQWLGMPAEGSEAPPQAPEFMLVIVEQGRDTRAMQLRLQEVRLRQTPQLIVRLSRRAAPEGVACLKLPPLDRASGLRILEALVDPSLHLVMTSLVTETGGNPAYTIELARTLSSARSGGFSGSLTSLLQARLDMLPAAQRYLLAQLALVGEYFWEGLVYELAANTPEDADALLAQDFLLAVEPSRLSGERELRFRSELLRQAALLMVPLAERPTLHERIARWLEAHQAPIIAPLLHDHRVHAGLEGVDAPLMSDV